MRMFLLLFLLSGSSLYAQDSIPTLMERGIAFHDKGNYEAAIKVYDEVMKMDKDHYLAHYEKSYSLYSLGKYADCIDLCKQILKQYPDGVENKSVYVNYGSSLDLMGKKSEAIKVYTKGIKQYPDFYLLPFNKAITEASNDNNDEAIEDLKASVSLNPNHASSHIYLAYLEVNKNKLAAAMAISVSLLLETKSERTFKNLGILEQALGGNVQQKDEKTINVTLPAPVKKNHEDDFSTAQMAISLKTAADFSKERKYLSAAEKLKDKLEALSIIDTNQKGFFTHFYLPFFAQMKTDNQLETACYIMYASSGNPQNKQWLEDNGDKIEPFYNWMKAFKWKAI